MGFNLEQLVREARRGDKDALEAVIGGVQDKIYGLALQMLADPIDAEDETQEILIKMITHLSDFREESAFSSWVYRIACNHLLTTRKRKSRQEGVTFGLLEDMISTETADSWPLALTGPEKDVLLEETRLACMRSVLACLEGETRMVFILGVVFGATSGEGAYIMDIKPALFRKRLSRGKKRIQDFMLKNCGLINENNRCSCQKMARPNSLHGRMINKTGHTVSKDNKSKSIRTEALAHLKELSEIDRATALFRKSPQYQSPRSFTSIVKDLIASGKYRVLMV